MLITLTSPVCPGLENIDGQNVLILFIISAGGNVTAEKLKRCMTDSWRSRGSFPIGFWNIAGAKINPALTYTLG